MNSEMSTINDGGGVLSACEQTAVCVIWTHLNLELLAVFCLTF
jgi:hypothetical protein